jgi:hypothetical protein
MPPASTLILHMITCCMRSGAFRRTRHHPFALGFAMCRTAERACRKARLRTRQQKRIGIALEGYPRKGERARVCVVLEIMVGESREQTDTLNLKDPHVEWYFKI